MCVSPTEFDVDVKRGSPPSLPLRRQRPKVLPHELGSVCEPVSPSHFSLCEKSSGPTLGGVEQHAPMKKRARPCRVLSRCASCALPCWRAAPLRSMPARMLRRYFSQRGTRTGCRWWHQRESVCKYQVPPQPGLSFPPLFLLYL